MGLWSGQGVCEREPALPSLEDEPRPGVLGRQPLSLKLVRPRLLLRRRCKNKYASMHLHRARLCTSHRRPLGARIRYECTQSQHTKSEETRHTTSKLLHTSYAPGSAARAVALAGRVGLLLTSCAREEGAILCFGLRGQHFSKTQGRASGATRPRSTRRLPSLPGVQSVRCTV